MYITWLVFDLWSKILPLDDIRMGIEVVYIFLGDLFKRHLFTTILVTESPSLLKNQLALLGLNFAKGSVLRNYF